MNRTKFFLTIMLVMGAVLAYSQSNSTSKNANEEFCKHWFLQVQGGVGYTLGEASFNDLLSPAAALSVGRQFSPAWALRGGFSGWQAKGSWVSPAQDYKFNYLQLHVDAVFDIANGLGQYNPKRFFNPYLFVGIAGNYGFNNDEAVEINQAGYPLQYLWEDSRFFVAGRGGVGFAFRLSNTVSFNLEGNANILSDHFNSKKAGNADWQFNALAGFTFRFGKAKKEAPASQETAPVIPETVPTQPTQPEKEEVKVEEPQPQKLEPIQENIFFTLNSYKIRTSEEPKIDVLVAYLKKNANTKITLTGYADKQTGNATINKRLSEQRAQQVAKALVAAGIAESRITIDSKGDTVQPFNTPEENRVTICITSEQ